MKTAPFQASLVPRDFCQGERKKLIFAAFGLPVANRNSSLIPSIWDAIAQIWIAQ
jgi:hypothetical protein